MVKVYQILHLPIKGVHGKIPILHQKRRININIVDKILSLIGTFNELYRNIINQKGLLLKLIKRETGD